MPQLRKLRTTTQTAAQAKADKYITPTGKDPKKAKPKPEADPAPAVGLSGSPEPAEAGATVIAFTSPALPPPLIPPRKPGRPTAFTQKLADYIIEELIEGKSLLDICAEDGMPHRSTILRWAAADQSFATSIAQARTEQAELMDDLIYKTAMISTAETAPADRVRVQALMWRARHLKPRKYGEQIELQHSGTIGTENLNLLRYMDPADREQLRLMLVAAAERQRAEEAQSVSSPRQIEGKARRA